MENNTHRLVISTTWCIHWCKIILMLPENIINYIILALLLTGFLATFFKSKLISNNNEQTDIQKSIISVFFTCLVV
ncbi:hypothetical protein [Campylobacter pinnipediorum]|uniref:hypothetical protein n=1 Tax=Campylobacter pinnipediorum TaxID=1965231 RepID=UPI001D04624F|nr:hypothetical protein [Campylobacter pinnipediorum]